MALTRLGWDVITSGSSDRLTGLQWITGKVRAGDAHTILAELCRRFDAEVEAINPAHSWGWANRDVRGADIISEHAAGTAVDLNAPAHPLGKSGTFSRKKVKAIRRILDDLGDSVRWGGDYPGRADEMHFELQGGVKKLAKVAETIRGSDDVMNVDPAGTASGTAPAVEGWPAEPLPLTDRHTAASHAAWVELLAAVGYADPDLGKAMQSWLDDLRDPRTGTGYYPMPPLLHDGIMGSYGVKALQRKLYDTKGPDGTRLYNGASDGRRLRKTVHAEITYLNLPQNRGL